MPDEYIPKKQELIEELRQAGSAEAGLPPALPGITSALPELAML